jgi:hypothetical protein
MSTTVVQRFGFVLILAVALTLEGRVSSGQGADPLIGTWTLDVFKSTYYTGEPPLRRTITFEVAGDGIRQTMVTTRQGFNISETVQVEYTAKLDGKDYPIKNSGLDTVALKRIDPTTVQRVGKIKDKPTETATLKLSNGGRTLTITTKGTTDAGAEYSRIEVFNRQPSGGDKSRG